MLRRSLWNLTLQPLLERVWLRFKPLQNQNRQNASRNKVWSYSFMKYNCRQRQQKQRSRLFCMCSESVIISEWCLHGRLTFRLLCSCGCKDLWCFLLNLFELCAHVCTSDGFQMILNKLKFSWNPEISGSRSQKCPS